MTARASARAGSRAASSPGRAPASCPAVRCGGPFGHPTLAGRARWRRRRLAGPFATGRHTAFPPTQPPGLVTWPRTRVGPERRDACSRHRPIGRPRVQTSRRVGPETPDACSRHAPNRAAVCTDLANRNAGWRPACTFTAPEQSTLAGVGRLARQRHTGPSRSSNKSSMARQDRSSVGWWYATPGISVSPALGLVKLCTAPP